MLRDDAIRTGLIKPKKADIDRMKLTGKELKEIIEEEKRHVDLLREKVGLESEALKMAH